MAEFDHNTASICKMLHYCNDIERAVERFGKSLKAFQADTDYQSACAMYILQIGELATVLSEDFREKYSYVPWRLIRAMRNIFAHDYYNMNIEQTWKTIETDIPELKDSCMKILLAEGFGFDEGGGA